MSADHSNWNHRDRTLTRSLIFRVAVALAFGAVALAANFLLIDVPPENRYFLFAAAVFAGAVYGGFVPGLISTVVLGAASSYFFLMPLHGLRVEQPGDFDRLSLFLLEGIAISGIGHLSNAIPSSHTRQPLIRYAFAISLSGAVIITKFVFFPNIARQLPFALCYAVVVVCAWLGGAGPAMFSTLVSSAAAYIFFMPRSGAYAADQRLAMFLLESNLLAMLIGAYRENLAWATASLRHIFLDSPAGMVVVLPDLRIVKANPAFCGMMSRSREHTEGVSLADLLHPQSRESLMLALRSRENGVSQEPISLHSFKLLNGAAVVATQMQATSVELRTGKRGWLIVTQDVTDREEAERRVLETEIRLRQAEKLEAVGLLATSIAHEFNNTLAVILGCSEQLAQARTTDELVLRNASEISRASHRAYDYSRQVLGFTRQEPQDRGPLDVNAVILECKSFLARLVGEHVELVTELADRLPPIDADAGRVEQILMNLAGNARDAMPGGGRLLIRTDLIQFSDPSPASGSVIAPGRYVTVLVADHGEGIAPGIMGSIFEPFFTTKPRESGTGLGLATVARNLKTLGGHVSVESTPGEGTRFTLYFPAARAVSERSGSTLTPAATIGEGETVLVVEDQEVLRRLVVETLSRLGYRVLEAEDFGQAVARAQGVHLDLVVTDVRLPGISGTEVVRKLLEIQPHLRVLYMTGDPEVDEETGAHSILEKPFKLEQLIAAVRQSLDKGAESR